MIDKIERIAARRAEIEAQLASPEVTGDLKRMEELGREYNRIGRDLPTLMRYVSVAKGLEENRIMLKTETDPEMIELAREEIALFEEQLPELEKSVRQILVPRDPADLKNAMVEIRAGTGGTEAGIFGSDLYRMYIRYAEIRGWNVEVLSTSEGDLGAIKEIVFLVSGEEAFGSLKFESGVHRVQRVPETESQGRIHTSAASVAVLPEADEIEVEIKPADLRIDVYRSSGPGGQSVNTTDSAVRVMHIPTGLIVTCQDEKSQLKNKAKALKVLATRLYEKKREEVAAKEAATRKSMVGSGDRSAKIRTYNFPQGRVTDHRINLTLYKLTDIMNGNIQELLDACRQADVNDRLED